MTKRIAALAFIFFCTSVAWIFLGSTLEYRTNTLDPNLKSQVSSIWGTAQQQGPPRSTYENHYTTETEDFEHHKRQEEHVDNVEVPLEASKVDVTLDLDHRQKGLLWYSTYSVIFAGDYKFSNPTDTERVMAFQLKLPADKAVYDNLVMTINGQPLPIANKDNSTLVTTTIGPKQIVVLHTGYHSQGLDSWRYSFGDNVAQIRDFSLAMHTNFKDIDFPENALSPTTKTPTENGWNLHWDYTNLVSGFAIGMTMPQKLQPGPLAGEISYFAPVSLFFFFFIIAMITAVRGIDLHPMNYFFLAAAFFAFHLLMAYLVDHMSIHAAFIICSVVSIFLVVSYLRLVVGLRFAAVEAGGAQFIYLVLFSYAFFFKGFTGLSITIGSILTLFVVMQATGRINWQKKFAELQGSPAK